MAVRTNKSDKACESCGKPLTGRNQKRFCSQSCVGRRFGGKFALHRQINDRERRMWQVLWPEFERNHGRPPTIREMISISYQTDWPYPSTSQIDYLLNKLEEAGLLCRSYGEDNVPISRGWRIRDSVYGVPVNLQRQLLPTDHEVFIIDAWSAHAVLLQDILRLMALYPEWDRPYLTMAAEEETQTEVTLLDLTSEGSRFWSDLSDDAFQAHCLEDLFFNIRHELDRLKFRDRALTAVISDRPEVRHMALACGYSLYSTESLHDLVENYETVAKMGGRQAPVVETSETEPAPTV